ncbi:MAG: DoxX family protein, partial [Lapillicoccus sp.]
GVAELVCAAGLLAPPTRYVAGWASAAVLVGVFPANVQMTVTAAKRWRRRPDAVGRAVYLAGTVARLPLQWLLVRVALSATGRELWAER